MHRENGADILLVTYRRFPDLSPDDRLLADALRRRRLGVAPACWDDPSIAWDRSRIAVLRSPWDYHLRYDAFMTWLARAAAQTTMVNPVDLVRWNTNKTYLLELQEAGLPCVPTLLIPSGAEAAAAARIDAAGWQDVVLKPVISASSHLTFLIRDVAANGAALADRLQAVLEAGDALCQPYIPEVETDGERALVFIGGAFSHAFRKRPFDSAYPQEEERSDVGLDPPPEEVEFGLRVLRALPLPPVYARIDIVPRPSGPVLMEAELTDPDLHFRLKPASAERLAEVLVQML